MTYLTKIIILSICQHYRIVNAITTFQFLRDLVIYCHCYPFDLLDNVENGNVKHDHESYYCLSQYFEFLNCKLKYIFKYI